MREHFLDEQANVVSVHAGFPNPATDTSLQALDLNRLLIRHSASTYMMRIAGNVWQRQGIFNGDIALIDRALRARPNDPVVWIYQDTLAISVRHQVPENAEIWGTVTAVIHQFQDKQ